jgi:hypothetical protein
MPIEGYYVCRKHSHTDKQHLWKVMSRTFKYHVDATREMETYKDMDPKRADDYFTIRKF